MRKSLKMKVGAVGTTFALAGALAVVASGTTGAYFSETRSGGITGTNGSIHISTLDSVGGGADHINLAFTNLMPGEPQAVTFKYTNTGPVAEDVYLTFPNRSALHAFNNAGTWAEATVSDGGGSTLFHSVNLNDDRPDATGTCGAFTPAGCWPLPTSLKVASNLAPDASGSAVFTFKLDGRTGNGHADKAFNIYPSLGANALDSAESGAGLPVNVVAVQVGQTP